MTQLGVQPLVSVGMWFPTVAAPSVPQVGPWQLVALAGEGSWSQVWRARPAEASPAVPAAYALKRLHPQYEQNAQALALLRREAAVGHQVTHPHLVPVLGASIAQAPYYLVMPWLEGASLGARLARGWRPDLPVALWLVRQVAEALEALHAAGWRHGDIKPSNILLSPEGHVTLLDLGFAQRTGEVSSLADRCVLGTCHYLAPEAITSALRPDIRSDLYSLGVVLFELLTGQVPFAGTTLSEVVAQHRQARPPELRKLAPRLPAAVACLVSSLLAKQPLRRPQTPRELIEQLAGLEILTFGQRAA